MLACLPGDMILITRRATGKPGIAIDPLVARCQAGDATAFTALYREHCRRVYRVCASMLRDPVEAEDAVQVVFTEAFRRLHTYDGSSRFSTWLYGVAIRVLANQRRSLWRRKRLGTAYAESQAAHKAPNNPEHDAALQQSFGHVVQAMSRIAEKNRTAFMLYHGAGLTLAEIALATGSPLQTAANRVQAARRDLLRLLPTEMAPPTEKQS